MLHGVALKRLCGRCTLSVVGIISGYIAHKRSPEHSMVAKSCLFEMSPRMIARVEDESDVAGREEREL